MKRSFLTILVMACCAAAFSQVVYNSSGRTGRARTQKEKGFDPDKLIFGGGLGASFGNITTVSVSPVLGYRITDNFSAGIGLGFLYYREKNAFRVYNPTSGGSDYKPLTATLFYPSVWTRYLIFRNFFVHAEFEYDIQRQKVHYYDDDPSSSTYGQQSTYKLKANSPALLLGAGLRQPVSDRVSLVLVGLYDVLQNENSPYRNRIDFRVGIMAGF